MTNAERRQAAVSRRIGKRAKRASAAPPPWLPLPDGIDAIARHRGNIANIPLHITRTQRFKIEGAMRDARVNLRDRQLIVPTGMDSVSRQGRVHELAHIRWTPRSRLTFNSPLEWGVYNACEDIRMWELLTRAGVDFSLTPDDCAREVAGFMFRTFDSRARVVAHQASVLFSAYGTTQFGATCDALWAASTPDADGNPPNPLIARDARLILNCIDTCLAICDKLTERRRPRGAPPRHTETLELTRLLIPIFADLRVDPDAATPKRDHINVEPLPPIATASQWGAIVPRDPPVKLSVNVAARAKLHTTRAIDVGSNPRNMHRLTIDGRVFSYKRARRIVSPTVLLDVSGSMHVPIAWVAQAIRAFPFCTIAQYSGSHDEGCLDILAQHGRACAPDDIPAGLGSNSIDGPALEWLATCTGPRIWVSDGQVNGRPGFIPQVARAEAARIVRLGGIHHVRSLDDAAAILVKFGDRKLAARALDALAEVS